MRENCDKNIEFVLIAEAGLLEAQALLLCESIRRFSGAYSQCPITVVSPRRTRRPSPSTVHELERLDVEYLPLDIESAFAEYGTSYRVHSLARVERRSGPDTVIQLDSDTIFVGEPDFSLARSDAAARPVDVKGMCTSGPSDPFDDYWRRLCKLVGVDFDQVPIIHTTVDGVAVRASYNGGLVAARRNCGIFQRTESFFRRLVQAGMKPWDRSLTLDTGSGMLQGEATIYWGTSQAAFSLAAVAGNHEVRLLAPTHNFPLHLSGQLAFPDSGLVHVHYHGLFSNAEGAARILSNPRLEVGKDVIDWLRSRLPLHSGPHR